MVSHICRQTAAGREKNVWQVIGGWEVACPKSCQKFNKHTLLQRTPLHVNNIWIPHRLLFVHLFFTLFLLIARLPLFLSSRLVHTDCPARCLIVFTSFLRYQISHRKMDDDRLYKHALTIWRLREATRRIRADIYAATPQKPPLVAAHQIRAELRHTCSSLCFFLTAL